MAPSSPLEEVNALAKALREQRNQGQAILDLTVSNPTAVELPRPTALLKQLGSEANAFPYLPDPQGEWPAREAIAAYLRGQGLAAQTEHLLLTSGTSEAYTWILKVLAKPGDEIITLTPGYPLCDALADYAGLTLLPWPMRFQPEQGRWHLDWEKLEQGLSTRSKALILIHPNNPTGQYFSAEDFAQALALAERHGLALILDTVFWDYAHDANRATPLPHSSGPLVFTVGGLSKTCALPQMKLGWLHLQGEASLVETSLQKLIWIADAFLSVATPIQRLTPELLLARTEMQFPLRARLTENLAIADKLLAGKLTPLWPEGGWSLPIALPHCPDDEKAAILLLNEDHVLVQPGYFFDISDEGHVVVSLLTPPEIFKQGLERLVQFCQRNEWLHR